MSERTAVSASSVRPARGESLLLEIDSLAHGGRGIARRNGYVVFVSGALPGDRVRARLTRAKRTTPRRGRSRSCSPSADRIPARCDHGGEPCPARPGRSSPTSTSSATSASRWTTRCSRHRRLRRLRAGADRARGRAVALPQQARVLIRGARRRAGPRLSRPRPLGPGRRRRGLPARLGGEQPRPQRDPGVGAREGPPRLRPPRRPRRPAKPGRPRGAANRQLQTRLVTSPAEIPRRRSTCTRSSRDPDPAPTGRPARSAGSTSKRSSPACASGSPTAPSSRRTPRWPSASTASPPRWRRSEATSDSSTSSPGSAPSAWRWPRRPARSGGSSWCGRPSRTRSTTRANEIGNARFRVGDARKEIRPLLEEAGRPTLSSSTLPGRGSRRRWSGG